MGEALQLVKAYAKQETLEPLKGAGRWAGLGLAGVVAMGLGTLFLVLGVLRMMQSLGTGTFHGQWMRLIPYLVALIVAGLVIAFAVWRISKPTLQKETST